MMIRLRTITILLVIALCGSYADARGRLFHRNRCRTTCCKTEGVKAAFPMHCLQEMWLDYAGTTDDIYICITEYGPECYDDIEEELWYGTPTYGVPQRCALC